MNQAVARFTHDQLPFLGLLLGTGLLRCARNDTFKAFRFLVKIPNFSNTLFLFDYFFIFDGILQCQTSDTVNMTFFFTAL